MRYMDTYITKVIKANLLLFHGERIIVTFLVVTIGLRGYHFYRRMCYEHPYFYFKRKVL